MAQTIDSVLVLCVWSSSGYWSQYRPSQRYCVPAVVPNSDVMLSVLSIGYVPVAGGMYAVFAVRSSQQVEAKPENRVVKLLY